MSRKHKKAAWRRKSLVVFRDVFEMLLLGTFRKQSPPWSLDYVRSCWEEPDRVHKWTEDVWDSFYPHRTIVTSKAGNVLSFRMDYFADLSAQQMERCDVADSDGLCRALLRGDGESALQIVERMGKGRWESRISGLADVGPFNGAVAIRGSAPVHLDVVVSVPPQRTLIL